MRSGDPGAVPLAIVAQLSLFAHVGGVTMKPATCRWLFAAFVFLGFAVPSVTWAGRDGATPPRLSMIEGQVAHWRPGNEDWEEATLNLPMAPGDALAVGHSGKLELQLGSRTFLRAGADSELALETQEPNYIFFKATAGRISLDVRHLGAGETIEIGTPQTALTIEQTGYYRLDLDESETRITTRRGGRARLTTPQRGVEEIAPDEEVVVDSSGVGRRRDAYDLDDWDQWNYERSERIISAPTPRYVSEDVYGADELEHYGTWQEEPTYGHVWVPQVEESWVPYSSGRWVHDPFYGWSWIDTAPWGWAPFHYGRWVRIHQYWGWAPGPFVVRPVYAPALVAFFGGSGFSVGFTVGVPAVSWVPLGWGEPCLPWWGSVGFVGYPWWGGWGGPRWHHDDGHHDDGHHSGDGSHNHGHDYGHVHDYQNARDPHAIVAVARGRFGNSPVDRVRLARVENENLRPLRQPEPRRPDTINTRPRRETVDARDTVLSRPVVSPAEAARRNRSAVDRVPERFHGTDATVERHHPVSPTSSAPAAAPAGPRKFSNADLDNNGESAAHRDTIDRHGPPPRFDQDRLMQSRERRVPDTSGAAPMPGHGDIGKTNGVGEPSRRGDLESHRPRPDFERIERNHPANQGGGIGSPTGGSTTGTQPVPAREQRRDLYESRDHLPDRIERQRTDSTAVHEAPVYHAPPPQPVMQDAAPPIERHRQERPEHIEIQHAPAPPPVVYHAAPAPAPPPMVYHAAPAPAPAPSGGGGGGAPGGNAGAGSVQPSRGQPHHAR